MKSLGWVKTPKSNKIIEDHTVNKVDLAVDPILMFKKHRKT